ncbi:MAG: M20/M25/M40 family metallo-hydrolase [Candidatus Aminicenantes bacterium]|nr:M20/M25/M40 family metallo-hydrolase [Candidatus Aminicenantes bacterium]
MKNKNHILINSLIIAVVIFTGAYSLYLVSPPDAKGQDTPLSEFSAERAMKHVKEMCGLPHFIGTAEHQRVRDYIVNQTKKLGLITDIQAATALHTYGRRLVAARVHNVIATLKGTHNTKALLIVGHYDSQLNTPGAADNGAATAAMLETARALKNSPPLQNDIVFLFTDGEEVGMMGAEAFVSQHPLMKNAVVVFNLEARGNKGPSLTFEVSNENGWIMKEYARAMPYPFAASLMYEVYKRMPNNTDFTIFKNAGLAGFNAAFVEGYVNYHSMTDTPENLDPRSLQHHGSYIINFARHFGRLTIDKTNKPDLVFFNPIGSWLVLYPGWLQLPLVLVMVLLYLLYLFLGIKQKQSTVKGLTGGFFLYLSAIISICILYWLVQSGIRALYPHYSRYYSYNFYNIDFYFYMMVGLVVGLFSTFYFLLFKKLKTANLQAGAITLFIIPAIFLYLVTPTAAYMMIYPLIFILLAGIITQVFKLSEAEKYRRYALLQLLAALPAIALYVPQVRMLFTAFSLENGVISVGLLLILLGFLIPQFKAAYHLSKYALPALALLAAIAAFIGAHITSTPSPTRPLQTNLIYCLDADTQKTIWVSGNKQTDEWNQWFFKKSRIGTAIYPGDRELYLTNDAPPATLPPPVLNLLEDRVDNNGRQLHFNLSSARQAQIMTLLFPGDAGITYMEIDGKPVGTGEQGIHPDKKPGGYTLVYYGIPPEGIDIFMRCKPGVKISLEVVESKLGLPVIPGCEYPPLPAHIIPGIGNSHLTLVKKTFEFQ